MTAKRKLFVGLLVVVATAGVVLYASRPGAEGQVTEYNLVQLRQGWNLVVWAADSQAADTVFGFANVVVVYGWRADTQSFSRYIPGRPEVSTLATAERDNAYWLLSNADALFQVPVRDAGECAEPTACPALPEPMADSCAGAKAQIELDKIVLEIAEQTGSTDPDEIHRDKAQAEQFFNENCQGVTLAEPSWFVRSCTEVGDWTGFTGAVAANPLGVEEYPWALWYGELRGLRGSLCGVP